MLPAWIGTIMDDRVPPAVDGSFSTLSSTLLSMMIARSYDKAVIPLVVAMIALTGVTIIIVRWVNPQRKCFTK